MVHGGAVGADLLSEMPGSSRQEGKRRRDTAGERDLRVCRCKAHSRRRYRRDSRRLPPSFRADTEAGAVQGRRNGAIAVGSIDLRAVRGQPLERSRRRMAIRVPGADRNDRYRRMDSVKERIGGGGPTPMMGNLQEVDRGQASPKQHRIDPLLDVARE